MNKQTIANMFWALEEYTDEELLNEFDSLSSDSAKFAAACLLMASESNERKAA